MKRGLSLAVALGAVEASRGVASALALSAPAVAKTAIAFGEGQLGSAISAPATALAEAFIRSVAAANLKLKAMLVVTLTAMTIGAAGIAHQTLGHNAEQSENAQVVVSEKATKKEPKANKGQDDAMVLQGAWRVVDVERNGKRITEDPSDMSLAFKGNEVTFGKQKLSFKIDAEKSPREIHMVVMDGKFKGQAVRTIYSLENGKLKLCMPLGPKSAQPVEFKTKAGDGLMLLVLRRPQDIPPPATVLREWTRPDAPPDGNYKLSDVDLSGYENTDFLFKLETRDGKQSVTILDAASYYAGAKILQTVISAKAYKPADRRAPQGVHIHISYWTSHGDQVFDGDFPYASLEVRGSLQTNHRIFPATLSATDNTKLKFTERDIRTPLMEKARWLDMRRWRLRNEAQGTKDPAEKTQLLREAAIADKEALAELPKTYHELFEKDADHPAIWVFALNLAQIATKYQIPLGEVRTMIAKADRTAATYGRRWQLELNTQIAAALAPQKAYAPVALEIAARLETDLSAADAPDTQARVLKALATAQSSVGEAGAARETRARLAKVENVIDRDYRSKVPPFKAESFAGRKGNSDRAVVLELFTGTQCPPCVAAEVAFEVFAGTYKPSDLVLIQYHLHIPGPDPLANIDGETRWEYYQKAFPEKAVGVPTALFNGKPETAGGGAMEYAKEKYDLCRKTIDPLLEVPAGARLDASAVKRGQTITVSASVSHLARPGDKVRLRLLLVEETIRFVGGNQVRFHHQVVRKLVGGPEGFALRSTDSTHTASVDVEELRKSLNAYLDDYNNNWRAFPIPDRPLDLEHLRVIALVQDDATREILQAKQVQIMQANAAIK